MTATTHYGPYDVDDYTTWKAALDAGVASGAMLTVTRYGNKVFFTEIPMLSASDDGTYITVSFNGTKLYRIVKATGQMQIAGGYDTDITL